MAMTFAVAGTNPTVATNTLTVTWPTATAAWGVLTHVCLFDAASGGHLLFWLPLVDGGDFTTPRTTTINAGDQFQLAGNQLRVRCD